MQEVYLRYAGHSILLTEGVYLFGRSPICNFCLDEPLVSRRHCQLDIRPNEAFFRDLQSVNGVYVNEQRVAGSVKLRPQDTLRIGRQELVFEVGHQRNAQILTLGEGTRALGNMLITGRSSALAVTPTRFSALTQAEATRQTAVLELVARAAEPLLLAGKVAEAENIVSGHLERVLREQRSGREIDDETFRGAVSLSLKLTIGRRDRKWFDHAICLLQERTALCSERLATDLKAAISVMPHADVPALYDYAHALRQGHPGSLEHLASAQRIEEVASYARARSLAG